MTRFPSALIVAAALLALLTIATFAPVRHFDFVHYDDFEFIVENPHIAGGFTAANVRWAIEHAYDGTGGPLTWLSHMTDVELYGLDAGGHHVTNLVIHTTATILLLLVLVSATGSVWRSTFVAALFAVHPLHVESVAWIAERKDVLSGVFWFAAIGAYVRYSRQPSLSRYAVVVVLFALGLLSKPMVVTLPFVLLLLDIWPLRRLSLDSTPRQKLTPLVVEKLPLVTLALLASYFTIQSQQHSGAVVSIATVPLSLRVANATVSYVAYLGGMFWPSGLIPYYPLPTAFSAVAVAGAAVLLVVLTVLAVKTIRRWPWIFVGWFWYLGTLLPVIGLVQVGGHRMADRFTYLPLVGIFIALAWTAVDLVERERLAARVVAVVAFGVIVVFAGAARAQVWHWQSGLALWQHTVNVDPDNARAWANLGAVLALERREDEAIRAYQESLRFEPGVPETLSNLGLALQTIGRRDDAIAKYVDAIQARPDYLKPRVQLATLLAASGRLEEAVLHMLEAVRLEPTSAQWRYFAGLMLAESGRTADAVQMLRSALAIDPNHAEARRALRELGDK